MAAKVALVWFDRQHRAQGLNQSIFIGIDVKFIRLLIVEFSLMHAKMEVQPGPNIAVMTSRENAP